jgi:hypothetical protein
MNASPIIRQRVVLATHAFVEIAIWRLPRSLVPCVHLYKYRLAYVVNDQCVLRYDNERGKGDHRHIGNQECEYVFVGPDQLIGDFYADIERWNNEHRRS